MTNKTPNKTKTPVGGLILGSDPIEFNAGRKTITLKVRNTGDRPIQVGSHFHFFEVNRALEFDRPRSLRNAFEHLLHDRHPFRAGR